MVAPTHRLPKTTRVRISKSGQITLPAKVRQQLGVEVGEQVDIVQEKDGTVRVKPVRILSAREIAGKFGPPIDPEEMREALREARKFGSVRQRYRDGSIIDDID